MKKIILRGKVPESQGGDVEVVQGRSLWWCG